MAITQAAWGDQGHTFVNALNDGKPCTIPAGHRLMAEIEGAIAEYVAAQEPAAVLPPISDRQFAQVLALDSVITEGEALAWAARGELPIPMEMALGQLPEDQQFAARMLLSSATTYERDHPMVPTLGALLLYDAEDLDDIWRRAAVL